MSKNCKNCMYHRTSDMANYGVCFRFPQTVNTVVTHWCGEFKEENVQLNVQENVQNNVQIKTKGKKNVVKTGE